MEYNYIGEIIKQSRIKQKFTQKQLAELLFLSDKTISKWERGNGLPDISMIKRLCEILKINADDLLSEDLQEVKGVNMKNVNFYVCEECENIIMSMSDMACSCHGKKLKALECKKANDEQKLVSEVIEDEIFLTTNHQMTKDNYILFLAVSKSDRVEIIRKYPEWNFDTRIKKQGITKIFWYSKQEGLYYQYI